jgi:UDP-N-acetylglucosamine transferase subunit ALG13
VIFVTLGTNEARFDRLLHAVAELGLHEEVVIQHGHSSPIGPPGAQLFDFLSFEGMVEKICASRAVVTHAGVGTIMVALANRKRPLVFPRRGALGEAVDDHQLQLGRRLAEAGLVTFVETGEELGRALSRSDQQTAEILTAPSSLAADLGGFLEHTVAPLPVKV